MPASSKARKQLLTDFRRTEIIAAALKTFGSKGFAATRAEDIAAQAGIAKGTLYLYFGSKEDIYVAAVQHAMDQLEFWLEQKSLYRLVLTIGREPQHRKQTNAVLRGSKQSIVALLEEGVAAGELKPQPFDAIAWAALDILRGANDRRLDGIATHSIEEDARFIIDLTLQFVGYKEPGRADIRATLRADA